MFVKVNKLGYRINLNQVLYVSFEDVEQGVRAVFHGSEFQIIANEPEGVLDKNTLRMMDVQVKSDTFASKEEAESWLDKLLSFK
jgi:hypothetical protein